MSWNRNNYSHQKVLKETFRIKHTSLAPEEGPASLPRNFKACSFQAWEEKRPKRAWPRKEPLEPRTTEKRPGKKEWDGQLPKPNWYHHLGMEDRKKTWWPVVPRRGDQSNRKLKETMDRISTLWAKMEESIKAKKREPPNWTQSLRTQNLVETRIQKEP